MTQCWKRDGRAQNITRYIIYPTSRPSNNVDTTTTNDNNNATCYNIIETSWRRCDRRDDYPGADGSRREHGVYGKSPNNTTRERVFDAGLHTYDAAVPPAETPHSGRTTRPRGPLASRLTRFVFTRRQMISIQISGGISLETTASSRAPARSRFPICLPIRTISMYWSKQTLSY